MLIFEIIIFGSLIGFLLGLLGGGGTILAVPVFVYLLKLEMKVAVAMSLAVVGATTFVASITHFIQKNINPYVVSVFGTSTILGAYIGVKIAMLLSDTVQLVMFASIMLIASYFMLVSKKQYQQNESKKISAISLILQGTFVGCLSSIVGVGGGFIIVPALVIAGNLPIKEAIGTSLVIICINASTGFLLYLQSHITIPLAHTIYFIICAICGTFLGSYCMKKVPQQLLKKIFAIFVLVMACFIFYKNLFLQ